MEWKLRNFYKIYDEKIFFAQNWSFKIKNSSN